MNISAFFPAYNEEANIEKLVLSLKNVLSEHCKAYEIIIVNDGSRDRTREIAERLAAEHEYVRVIHHRTNRGYGGAVISGLCAAKLEWVFFTDGDNQFDVSEMPLLIAMTNRYDFVAGHRLKRNDPPYRRVNAFFWNLLVQSLFRFSAKDVDCAFKLIRKEIIDQIRPETTGAMISTELFAKATKLGYRIGEVGVHHYPRKAGTQTGAKLKVILKAFGELFQFYGRMKKWGNSSAGSA